MSARPLQVEIAGARCSPSRAENFAENFERARREHTSILIFFFDRQTRAFENKLTNSPERRGALRAHLVERGKGWVAGTRLATRPDHTAPTVPGLDSCTYSGVGYGLKPLPHALSHPFICSTRLDSSTGRRSTAAEARAPMRTGARRTKGGGPEPRAGAAASAPFTVPPPVPSDQSPWARAQKAPCTRRPPSSRGMRCVQPVERALLEVDGCVLVVELQRAHGRHSRR